MTLTTLVIGATAAAREAAIAAVLELDISTALILEGLPDGASQLDSPASNLHIARLAPGCLCCTGNLAMRVTLNRILRARPERLYISLAAAQHLERVHSFLIEAPYDDFLQLTKDLRA